MEEYDWDKYKNPFGLKLEDYVHTCSGICFGNLGHVYILRNGEIYFDPSGICAPPEKYVIKDLKENKNV